MRVLKILALAALIFVWPLADQSRADVDVGMSIGDGGIESFYLAIGDYYKAPQKELVVVRQRKIPAEELPVVYFIARNAGVAPGVIIELRLGGKSWMAICTRYGLTADIFYVPVKSNPGPPFGKAYGHFKKRGKGEWKKVQLDDADIINFVNLRFISEHYGYSPDDVIRMREKGKNFISINAEVKKNKTKGNKQSQKLAVDEKSKSAQKDKGKKREK